MKPRLSIVVPNYNHGHVLRRCLYALTMQTVMPHEIILVDDGSTDNSLEMASIFGDKIKVIRHETNQGVYAALRTGARAATGDYVAFPAADDMVRPELVERALQALEEHPQAGIFTGICKWNDPTGLSWHSGPNMPDKPCHIDEEEVTRMCVKRTMCVAGQHAFHRLYDILQIFDKVPWLDPMEDLLFANVCMFRGGVAYVPEVLSEFNLSPESFYNRQPSKIKREACQTILKTLLLPEFSDVAPKIIQSGCLSDAGFTLYGEVMKPRNWKFASVPLLKRGLLRFIEWMGRKFIPKGLAKSILEVHYKNYMADASERVKEQRMLDGRGPQKVVWGDS